jgi:predicted RNA-binding protein Jag
MDQEIIKKIIEEFFQKMDLVFSFNFSILKDTILVDVKLKEEDLEDPEEFIFAAQLILRNLLRKKTGEKIYLDLDINDYKKKRIKYLKELARKVADEVALTKKQKILDPMPAYERRIIHLEIAQRNDVLSESIDKEPKRRVVIKPYP